MEIFGGGLKSPCVPQLMNHVEQNPVHMPSH